MAIRTLLIDIGNTNIKWAIESGGVLGPIQALPHGEQQPLQLARECFSGESAPDRILIASVVDRDLHTGISDWMKGQWGLDPELVEVVRKAGGVTNGYRDPAQLGIDRWLAMIAAHNGWRGHICVVDCGTAITVDLLDDQGVHAGGLIIPGFDLMREVLLTSTGIPRVVAVENPELPAYDTAAGVAAGALYAAAALVERMLEESGGRLNRDLTLLLTGSDAGRLQKALRPSAVVVPDLVIRGLACLAEKGIEV